MSMNVYIYATRKAWTKNKAGKKVTFEDIVKFNAVQTPTSATHEILNSANPEAAYCKWVLAHFEDQIEDVFADDDLFCERAPVGKQVFNYGREHVKRFNQWKSEVDEQGYTIKFEMI